MTAQTLAKRKLIVIATVGRLLALSQAYQFMISTGLAGEGISTLKATACWADFHPDPLRSSQPYTSGIKLGGGSNMRTSALSGARVTGDPELRDHYSVGGWGV
jgi:hypothetical protein